MLVLEILPYDFLLNDSEIAQKSEKCSYYSDYHPVSPNINYMEVIYCLHNTGDV